MALLMQQSDKVAAGFSMVCSNSESGIFLLRVEYVLYRSFANEVRRISHREFPTPCFSAVCEIFALAWAHWACWLLL